MNMFDEDDKIYMTFTLKAHGREYTVRSEYEDSVSWAEIVDDVVKLIEGNYGYAFNLLEHDIGIYYPGKEYGGK